MPPLKATQLELFPREKTTEELEGEIYNMEDHYMAVIDNWYVGTGSTKDAAIKSAIQAYQSEDEKP